jgi:dihydroorotate dehydrogenase (fumarate)
MSVDLSTTYLGLKLKNPLAVAACTLTQDPDVLKRLEAGGASAAVLPSLFEEQIEYEDSELAAAQEYGADFYAEHGDWFPEQEDYRQGPAKYLDLIGEAKKAVDIPVIASLNGSSLGGWTSYARMMQDAGADALELNIYLIAADVDMTAEDVEKRYLELVQTVKESVSIPLAVKMGPFFSSPGNMAKKVVGAGADGLVLFNRFLQPDIDLETMAAQPKLVLSNEFEALLPLRWIAILRGRVEASLAHTRGLHSAEGLIKTLLAGADVGMVASVLYRGGITRIGDLLDGLSQWMEENEYESVEQLKGSMSQQKCPDPGAFERGNYMKALTSFTAKPV